MRPKKATAGAGGDTSVEHDINIMMGDRGDVVM